ncbi:MAG: asparagine synthase (glutamine-hydrolyzing) [Patescibacteria group bacterium]
MCGIAGYIGDGNQKILKKMTDLIKYRGPDDEGFYLKEGVGLGMRRLSIIDLVTGKQPIYNEDKSVVVVFNGEIYNFQELRKELILKGHRFYTDSDTEVIVHQYEENKENCFKRFNGMFAIAIWDNSLKKIILARDRLGKKPLYYTLQNNTFIFASELKALISHPSVKKELDFNSLNKYLTYEYIPAPWAIFKNVFKLEPANYLVYSAKEKNYKIRQFWDINFNPISNFINKENCLKELENRLSQAVKYRLISDVPLGVLLSGGLDSSTVTYYAQKNSDKKIRTFFIGFTEKSYDESLYSSRVAKFLGTEHYVKILKPKDSLRLIPEIYNLLDEPLADPSLIPTYLLSKITREEVTVALAGDGGDELFAGYDTHLAHKIVKYYEIIPEFLRKNINKILLKFTTLLPVSYSNLSFDFRFKKMLSGLDYPINFRHQVWLGAFLPSERENLFTPDAKNKIDEGLLFNDLKRHWDRFPQESVENKLLYLDFKQYLQDDILTKVDRASMYNSLEVRAPFLDYRVVDFVCSLPFSYKFRYWQRKYLLKELMKDKLPAEVIYRKKKGFGIPLAKWMKKELKKLTLDLLEKNNIKRQDIFNHIYIEKLLNEHFNGKRDNRKLLWALMVFQIWYKNYYKV